MVTRLKHVKLSSETNPANILLETTATLSLQDIFVRPRITTHDVQLEFGHDINALLPCCFHKYVIYLEQNDFYFL